MLSLPIPIGMGRAKVRILGKPASISGEFGVLSSELEFGGFDINFRFKFLRICFSFKLRENRETYGSKILRD
jgi:hypothetical protein